MALYCIGDIQGCEPALQRLLEHIDFSPSRDTVYLLGDLVNRGPASADVLRHCIKAGDSIRCLLGNHDLHLLAISQGVRAASKRDTLSFILQAPDREELLNWLRHQPLMRQHQLGKETLLMVHAGLLPSWTASAALAYAQEIATQLQSPNWRDFLQQVFGNQPQVWSEQLQGPDRWRVIINTMTRMRFCSPQGALDFSSNEAATQAPPGLLPWFDAPARQNLDHVIAFGHWSTLGLFNRQDVLGLDTGCVWGGCLTAVRFGASLSEREILHVECEQAQVPG